MIYPAKANNMSCPVQQNVHTGEKASGTAKVNGEDKPASGEYMKWDAEGVEVVPPEEEKKIYEVSAQFNRFQMMNLVRVRDASVDEEPG